MKITLPEGKPINCMLQSLAEIDEATAEIQKYCMNKTIICGIYKITSPTGKIYIGKAVDIYSRWRAYEKQLPKNQKRLFYSFRKYGVKNHVFEVIKVCLENHLNYYEIYYIRLFKTYRTPHGLNCTCGGDGSRGHVWSEKSKKNRSIISKRIWKEKKESGKPLFTEEHRKNLSISAKAARAKQKQTGMPAFSKSALIKRGKSLKLTWAKRKSDPEFYSEKNKAKRSIYSGKGKKRTEEQRKTMSIAQQKIKHITRKKNIGKKRTAEQILNIKLGLPQYKNPAKYYSEEEKIKRSKNHDSHKVHLINTSTGIFYLGFNEAAASIPMKMKIFRSMVMEHQKNKTSFVYA